MACALAKEYFDGSILATPVHLTLRVTGPASLELRFNTLRGFYYKLQSTPSLDMPFTDEEPQATPAFDTWRAHTNSTSGPQRFYRVAPFPGP